MSAALRVRRIVIVLAHNNTVCKRITEKKNRTEFPDALQIIAKQIFCLNVLFFSFFLRLKQSKKFVNRVQNGLEYGQECSWNMTQ